MTVSENISQIENLDIFEGILSGLNTPVFVVDSKNNFIYANTSGEEFFRSGLSILRNLSLTKFINVEHSIFEMIQRVRQTCVSFSDQGVELFSEKLGQRLIDVQISPLFDDNRENIGTIIAIQERALAERLRGQEQFRGGARSMTSLSSLLAHEINNPLAGIRGAAELLNSGVEHNEISDLTNLIITEADRIASLLTRMEKLAVGQAIARESVNIHEIINHSINLTKRSFGKNREILTSFDPSLPNTEGDKNLLIQVILNLIKNACEATKINGKIWIKTSFNLGARYSSFKSKISAPLVIEVVDDGVGIEPEMRDYIFDPFVSSKSSGSGLGLSLVASTIADHGGSIEVVSKAGMTSFKINLPISDY